MAKKPHVVNVIPTYNEVENIQIMLETLHQIAHQQPQYTFSTLVIDDNSPDGTGEAVRKFQRTDKSVSLLQGNKQGLGIALKRGFQYAINTLNADIIVSNDADFQFNPHDIPRLLEKIDQGYDVVVASRHVPGGDVEGWPMGRSATHWIANTVFASWVAGITEVRDHNGNFRAYRVKNSLEKIDFNRLPAAGYGFLNYILFELSKHNLKFTEVPILFGWRQRGETKVSFNKKYIKSFIRDTFEYIKLCLNIRAERWGWK